VSVPGLQIVILQRKESGTMGQMFRPQTLPTNPISALDPETLVAKLGDFAPGSDAEALKMLRARFPESPLSLRVAALDYLMRRRPREIARDHSPR
jgi:hypothetical protein